MNPAHIHLMLNHVPLFGALAATALFALALLRRQQGLARGGLVVAILTALVALLVYFTGEPAEELVENLPGVSEAVLETHEEVAGVATIAVTIFGVLALFSAFLFRHGVTMRFTRVLLVGSLVPLAAIAYTAYLGGQVRHSEIRPGAGAGEAGENHEDDDAMRLGPSIAFAAPESFARDTVDLVPPSIREEHAAPHFAKEEEVALPPLSGLPALAAREAVPDAARLIALALRLEAELPTMLEEHREIGAAIEVLVRAAEAANRPEYAELGEEILHHARSEEEITYPAAILVGRYLRTRAGE